MIARLFLVVLGLGLAIAQQEYVLFTNGHGGEHCGVHHVCLTDAQCVDRDGIPMCECSDDKMYGNGKLQCLPGKDNNVWIQNDPHMKNFYKEFASLETPCPYRVLNLVFKPELDTEVFLDLFAQNSLFHEGHYFLTRLILSTTVYLGGDMMKQVMELEGDVHTDINNDAYNYTFIARSLDTALSDVPEGVSSMVTSEDERFENYTMVVDKDALNNLLNVEIKGLGIKLLFRPACQDESLNNIMLPMVPGAVFNIKKENWEMVNLALSEFDIASFPQGPSLKDQATELQVSKPIYLQYLLLSNSSIDIGYSDPVCYETHRIFEEECPEEQDKLAMIQTCMSIYNEPQFLICLTEKHSMEEYRTIHKKFFQICEKSLCMKNATECERMQKEMPLITECPLPGKIQQLDCSSLSANAAPQQGRSTFY